MHNLYIIYKYNVCIYVVQTKVRQMYAVADKSFGAQQVWHNERANFTKQSEKTAMATTTVLAAISTVATTTTTKSSNISLKRVAGRMTDGEHALFARL